MKRNIVIVYILMLIFVLQLMPVSVKAESGEKNIMDFAVQTEMPETEGGKWEIKDRPYSVYADYDFEKNAGDFQPVYGQWYLENGKYVQKELSIGAAARNLLPDYYSDFVMEFDAVPLSHDTKLMVFFGCVSLYDVCVAEITKDGSNLIIGENEYKGTGTIEKGKEYHIKFEIKDKKISLYLDNELILEEDGLEFNEGQIGIGCWNSNMEVDNFSILAPDKLGSGTKLTQTGEDFARAFMNNEKNYPSFSAQLASDSYIDGECGIAALCEDKGYYFGVKNNRAYLSYDSGNGTKTLAETEYHTIAATFYDFKINISDNKIICYINQEKLFSEKIDRVDFDRYAVFSRGMGLVCSSMTASEELYEYQSDAVFEFTQKNFTDIGEEKYEEAVNVLNGLEIIGGYSDSTYRGNEKITRGEFAQVLFNMQDAKPGNSAKVFEDIPEDYPFRQALCGAIEKGYLSAEENSAKPYEAVTGQEAVDIMLKILNAYLPDSDSTFMTAQNYGILENFSITSQSMTRYEMAQLVFNTLKADRMMPVMINASGVVIEKTGSMFEEIFDVQKIQGTVYADKYSNILKDTLSGLNDGEIKIEDGIFEYGKDVSEYLGCCVTAYVKKYDDIGIFGKILHLKKYKTTVTQISDSQLIFNDNNEIIEYNKYYDSEKTTKIKLQKDTKIIYNGLMYANTAEAEKGVFNIENGSLTVVDNQTGNGVEYVFVWSYKTAVVDSVSGTNGLIYCKNEENPITADEEEKVIFKKGKDISSIENINEYDVLSIAQPKSKDGYTVILISDRKPAMGTVKSKGEDYVIIGSDEYEINTILDTSLFSVTDYVTAYLDFNNKVSYIVKRVSEDYGYLVSTLFDDNEENLMLKMFTAENGKGKFNLSESVNVFFSDSSKVRYQRNRSKSNSYRALKIIIDDILDSSRITDTNGNLSKFGVLIKYKLNNDGEIKEINFAKDKTSQDVPDGKSDFACYYDSQVSGETAYYYSGLINSKYRITGNTKIISLSGDCTDIDNFSLVASSSLPWDDYYDSRIYDVNEEFEAKILVIQDMNLGYDRPAGIISGVERRVDEKDNNCVSLTMYQNGQTVTINTVNEELECDSSAAYWFKNEGTKIKDLKVGDIIIYDTDSEGYIKWFAVIFKNKEQDFYATSPRGWYWGTIPSTDMTVTYTPVTKRVGNIFVFNSNDYARPITEGAGTYYIYNKNRDTITPAGFDDIKAGDKVFLIFKSAALNTVVIYR